MPPKSAAPASASASVASPAASGGAKPKLAKKKPTLAALLARQKAKAKQANARRQVQQLQQPEEEEGEDESSSSGEDSDNEIELTAGAHVKATVTPIVEGDDGAQKGAKQKKQKQKGTKRKAESAASSSSSDDGESADGDSAELIDVEFGIYDPQSVDYFTLKMLLKDLVHAECAAAAGGRKKKKKKGGAKGEAESEEEGSENEDSPAAAAAATTPSTPSSSTPAPSADSTDDFALHELCDALVAQRCVGSMIKAEGTDEPLGFASVLNLAWAERHGKNQDGKPVRWVQQLKRYILSLAPASAKPAFHSALSSPSTGLLLQSRLVNVPPQIVPALHRCLLEDMAWATREVEGEELRQSFRFERYVTIGRMFRPLDAGARKQQPAEFASAYGGKKKAKKAARAAAAAAASSASLAPIPTSISPSLPPGFEWLRFEEELFHQACSSSFAAPCPFTPEDADAGRTHMVCVPMILEAEKLPGIVQRLQEMAAVAQ